MFRRKIFFLLIPFFVTATTGVVGYQFVEGWDLGDAIYMTAITLTTTGYGEVKPLSPEGRMFTVCLLVMGLMTISFVSTMIANELLKYNLKDRKRSKMQKKISKLNGHTIVLGYGRMGKSIVSELEKAGFQFVIVEQADYLTKQLIETKYLWLEGSGADDELLQRAGIEKASHLVSAIDDEGDGLFAAVAAKALNPEIKVIVRADSEASRRKMLLAGADRVILPYTMSGIKVGQIITNPNIEDVIEVNKGDSEADKKQLKILDIPVEEDSILNGQSLSSCGLSREGLMVVGVRREKEGFIFAPPSDLVFQVGDYVVAVGTMESCHRSVLAKASA